MVQVMLCKFINFFHNYLRKYTNQLVGLVYYSTLYIKPYILPLLFSSLK